MSVFDIILILLLGIGFYKGYKQGFIVEIFSLLAFFLGLFLAIEFTIPVSLRLFGATNFFDVGAIIVFIGLFIILSIIIKAGAKAIKRVVDFTFLGTLDNAFGALAGALKTAFIISIVFWVFDSVGFDSVQRYTDDSLVFGYIVNIGPSFFEWISVVIPYVRDLIDSMENLPGNSDAVLTHLINYI